MRVNISAFGRFYEPIQSKEYLESFLHERADANQFYTRMGSNSLISVRKLKVSRKNVLDASGMLLGDVPMLKDISTSALIHLKEHAQDQSILLLGEDGSGTVESFNELNSDLTKGNAMVGNMALCANRFITSFGSAIQKNGSRHLNFIRHNEYQYSKEGSLVGVKFVGYLLDSMVFGNESTFQILYDLAFGAPPEIAQQLWLNEQFLYLRDLKDVQKSNPKAQFEKIQNDLDILHIDSWSQSQIFKILAAILHLGNIKFSPGYINNDEIIVKQAANTNTCVVQNQGSLMKVAELLGVDVNVLEMTLIVKTTMIGKDKISKFLDIKEAEKHRDALASLLYANLFEVVLKFLNSICCKDEKEFGSYIAVLNLPGIQCGSEVIGKPKSLHQFLFNYAHERVLQHVQDSYFELGNELLRQNLLEQTVDSYSTNSEINRVQLNLMTAITKQASKDASNADELFLQKAADKSSSQSFRKTSSTNFVLEHFGGGLVEYDVTGWTSSNANVIDIDFVSLFRGSPDYSGTTNQFVKSLFSESILDLELQNKDPYSVTTVRRKAVTIGSASRENSETLVSDTQRHIEDLISVFKSSKQWFVHHINPSNGQRASWDSSLVQRQIQMHSLVEVSRQLANHYSHAIAIGAFIEKFQPVFDQSKIYQTDPVRMIRQLIGLFGWSPMDVNVNSENVLMAEGPWRKLLHELELENKSVLQKPVQPSNSSFQKVDTMMNFVTLNRSISSSGKSIPLLKPKPMRFWKDPKVSRSRKCWLGITWALTCCLPSFCLSSCGGMKRSERRLAWREKVALCILIFLVNCLILFLIIGLGITVCPRNNMLSIGELSRSNSFKQGLVYMYGEYYQIPNVLDYHVSKSLPAADRSYWENNVLGRDVGGMFTKISHWDTYCGGFPEQRPFRLFVDNLQGLEKTWYNHSSTDYIPVLKRYKKGDVVWSQKNIDDLMQKNDFQKVVVAYNRVYDVSPMFAPFQPNVFLGKEFEKIFREPSAKAGDDMTAYFDRLRLANPSVWKNGMNCMDNLFYVGQVDHRRDIKCIVTDYLLLSGSIIIVAVIGLKFLASLQFGHRNEPEPQEKYVICLIPCYTENEKSLRGTVDSIALTDYADRQKLLFLVADGMVIGGGNELPTPRILLNILGVSPNAEPKLCSYQALGPGSKQLNYAQVYSGLYNVEGRKVPFIAVIKIGQASERVKPGNRGKRDSQMILMQFLSKVHQNEPMNELQLNIYDGIQNVIGLDPRSFELVLMVDADTMVRPESLNRMVAYMKRDTRVIGLTGETMLANEKASWTTMIQIYEYYISQHMTKAFESLFGTVTCLPGCFSIYRIRTPRGKLILASKYVIDDYGVNDVNTLHLKNLLFLGEDRYLTTLLLKHFPDLKTSYFAGAKCKTYAPDTLEVLRSQRRRWINSTVHNLFELLDLRLFGSACCSMRLVVFLDLVATFTQPAVLVYLGYLLYVYLSDSSSAFPFVSIVMIAAVFGLQMILFLAKLKFENIGWMLAYFVAIPVFSLYLPFHSFWNFDDFSWGNTRVVVENGRQLEQEAPETLFDPSMIKTQTWAEFEKEEGKKYESSSETGWSDGNSSTKSTTKSTVALNHSRRPSDVSNVSMESSQSFRHASFQSFGSFGDELKKALEQTALKPKPELMISKEELIMLINFCIQSSDLQSLTRRKVREYIEARKGVVLDSKTKKYLYKLLEKQVQNLATDDANSDAESLYSAQASPKRLLSDASSSLAETTLNSNSTGDVIIEPARLQELIQSYLRIADLNRVTRRDVRTFVEIRTNIKLNSPTKKLLHQMLDEELAKML